MQRINRQRATAQRTLLTRKCQSTNVSINEDTRDQRQPLVLDTVIEMSFGIYVLRVRRIMYTVHFKNLDNISSSAKERSGKKN